MKKLTKFKNIQKMIASIVMFVIIISVFPNYSSASWIGWVGGKISEPIIGFVLFIGDAVEGVMQKTMAGVDRIDAVTLDTTNPTVTDGIWKYTGSGINIQLTNDDINEDGWGFEDREIKIPNIIYSPEEIFSDVVEALDINFLNPGSYNKATEESSGEDTEESSEEDRKLSLAESLQPTIKAWYQAFRNIAIVGLLSVLVYLGIRILISSTAGDKAKYKEALMNWAVALCLVFFMHYIMAGILGLTSLVNNAIRNSIDTTISVDLSQTTYSSLGGFDTNFMGYIRFRCWSKSLLSAFGYVILYIGMVAYTVSFTFMYLKRVLYVAFFTMIAPLVALTYPIDKYKDGKAQAFNMWFKEYTMNVIIQPVHLILYQMFLGSVINIAVIENPVYAIVVLWFMSKAEKLIKQMFGLDKGSTAGGFGDFATGAMAMQGMNALKGLGKGKSNDDKATNDANKGKVRTLSNPEKLGSTSDLMGIGAGSTGGTRAQQQSARETGNQPQAGGGTGTQSQVGGGTRAQQQSARGTGNQLQAGGGTRTQPQVGGADSELITGWSVGGTTVDPSGDSDSQDVNSNVEPTMLFASDLADYAVDESSVGSPDYAADESSVGSPEVTEGRDNEYDAGDLSYDTAHPWGSTGEIVRGSSTEPSQVQQSEEYKPNYLKKLKVGAMMGGQKLWDKRRKIAKLAGKGMGAVAGATIGLGAAIATNDISSFAKYGVAGAAAGGVIGSRAANAGASAIESIPKKIEHARDVEDEYDIRVKQETEGYDAAEKLRKERQEEKENRELMKSKEERQKARAWLEKNDPNYNKYSSNRGERNVKIDEYIKKRVDYNRGGVKDEEIIKKALIMEQQDNPKATHKQMIAAARLAQRTGEERMLDEKKREQVRDKLRTQLGGDERRQSDVESKRGMDLVSELLDIRRYYEGQY